jgi:hypothetical protein
VAGDDDVDAKDSFRYLFFNTFPSIPAPRVPLRGAQRTARKDAKKLRVWKKQKLVVCDGWLGDARFGMAENMAFYKALRKKVGAILIRFFISNYRR